MIQPLDVVLFGLVITTVLLVWRLPTWINQREQQHRLERADRLVEEMIKSAGQEIDELCRVLDHFSQSPESESLRAIGEAAEKDRQHEFGEEYHCPICNEFHPGRYWRENTTGSPMDATLRRTLNTIGVQKRSPDQGDLFSGYRGVREKNDILES